MGSAILLTSMLSIVRKIKCGIFIKTSIICRTVKWAWRIFVNVIKWIFAEMKACKSTISGAVSKKTGIIFTVMLLTYTAIIGLFGVLLPESAIFLLFAIIIFGLAAFVLAYRARDIDEIKKGADEIRSGNLHYKIPELKSEDMKELANNINDIADGLEKSVSAKLKAERLKTDLITNVSHDLKTPLTSIINYTELLSGIEGLPQEAKDYIAIIAKKSERLKNLTRDLFEVSKVQSGNEHFIFEKLDTALLINQSLGEHDSEIRESGLTFCVKTDKELHIMADGGKMSRVLGNLIDNALKYAMKNTRVFISAYRKDNEVMIELKNTSAYPMDFDAEEITGRFVRGDKSRTDSGNGLGLAIAKSYTEACGGKFDIVIDGDLFKVIIRFEAH